MASAARILHVGDDICHRIPVMERAGLFVVQSESSVGAIEDAFVGDQTFSGIAFHNDLHPPQKIVVSAARSLSTARFILFKNPSVECADHIFDLVIPSHTSPAAWLKSLKEAIEEARRVREFSAELRQGSVDVRSESERLLAACARAQEPLDFDVLRRDKNRK